MISDNQVKALKIIDNKIAIGGLEFAQKMWPDSNMHDKEIGKIIGYSHSYLYKLVRRGWIKVHEYKYPQFMLTQKGIDELKTQ